MSMQFKLAYNKEEAGEMISVSVRTVDYLIASGELSAKRIGKRVVITHQALVQFLRRDHTTRRAN
jgi:excisionase family DNA binding protein